MMGLSALNQLNFASEGRDMRTRITNRQLISSIDNINQITQGEHEHGKYCGSLNQLVWNKANSLAGGQLIWKI